MHHIIYLSSAVTPFTKPELMKLLEKARDHNSRHNITGILLYKDGNFLQAIEGDQETLRALYRQIEKDSRHRGLVKLFDEPIAEREFPAWSMGFRDLGATNETVPEGYSDLLNANWAGTDFTQYSGKLRAFMKLFGN
jgi:hypothetical protein